ncbi:V-set and immunoglobulin domain-containing protein 8-like [Oreochromis aureus]|uniref:V-set and immunoglobulin domain-containing protein 8-like n=1 Tax=Oreochromis aureus TaxID=47969 RepID=UPI001954B9B4|nr:V-set and immunoglobulin domain-containing protein 8-like [Oreochromis aureus]
MAGLIWILLSAYLLGCTSQDQKNITAESGQDVILTCRAPNYTNQNFKWSRADLGDEYVLLYRDEVFVPEHQHPSFKNRVDLQDKQMKDGDVSLILKDVTPADSGTYKCHVNMKTNRSKRANLDTDPISIITLSVDPPGSVGLIVGVVVAAALVVAAVAGFVIYRNHKKAKEVLLFSSKYLRPLIIKQSPAAVPTSQCYQ